MDEPVLTPYGFVPMGSLQIGSEVTTTNGGTAKVMQIHYQGVVPTYKIKFVDGAETRCTAEHLWKIWKARCRGGWRLKNTEEVAEMVNNKGYNVLVPLAEEVEFYDKVELPFKPYTLGVLLGDGCLVADCVFITKSDKELFEHVRDDGYELKSWLAPGKTSYEYVIVGEKFKREKAWLKECGLNCKSGEKYIPEIYKKASIEDRYEILRGLLDTDGYADIRGHVQYSSCSKRLAEDVQWIVRSLGGKATITEKDTHYTKNGVKIPCQKAYMVYIQTRDNSRLFKLERKKNRCVGVKFNGGYSELKRRIVSVERDGYDECQCITLDSEDGLYITRDFVVTHNSFAMLMEPLRYKNIKGFNAVIFRSQFADIVKSGGLWEESEKLYSQIKGATPRMVDKQWVFRDKKGNVTSKVTFAYVNDQNLPTWKGSQIALIGFDEVCDISEKQFFFMLSRNRSACGVAPYIRATCNPDPDSWVAKFIEWWIDQDTGYAIPERSGVIRWFVRRDEKIYWADTKEELWEKFELNTPEEKEEPRSVTFIASSVYDNKELLKVNPQYLGNLKAMAEVERERFLKGNWKIKPAAGLIFKRSQVNIIEAEPTDLLFVCRAWDIAATEKKEKSDDPDYTAGVLMGKRKNGRYVILDVINQQVGAAEVENLIRNTAIADRKKYGHLVRIRLPQDPGGAGKIVATDWTRKLAGFSVKVERVTGSKVTRANPLAAQWQVGNVDVLAADWNDAYFKQLEFFPEGKHDDMVDASSDSFNELSAPTFNVSSLVR